jgi:O-antigen/teichoic acid export membrane protein
MKISNKLISNTLYLFLDWFVLILTGFLYWMIAGKTLLPEEYGIVSTSINFAIFFSGISLIGLPTTLNKLIPEYLSKKEGKRITSLIRFSTKVIILTNLSILLVIILLSTSIALLLKVTREVVWISAATLIVLSFFLNLAR